jgi:hypothetical protein
LAIFDAYILNVIVDHVPDGLVTAQVAKLVGLGP